MTEHDDIEAKLSSNIQAILSKAIARRRRKTLGNEKAKQLAEGLMASVNEGLRESAAHQPGVATKDDTAPGAAQNGGGVVDMHRGWLIQANWLSLQAGSLYDEIVAMGTESLGPEYDHKHRALTNLESREGELMDRIATTPARTADGLRVQLLCLAMWSPPDNSDSPYAKRGRAAFVTLAEGLASLPGGDNPTPTVPAYVDFIHSHDELSAARPNRAATA